MQMSHKEAGVSVATSAVGGVVGAKVGKPGWGAAIGSTAGLAGVQKQKSLAAKVPEKPGSRQQNKHPNVRGY